MRNRSIELFLLPPEQALTSVSPAIGSALSSLLAADIQTAQMGGADIAALLAAESVPGSVLQRAIAAGHAAACQQRSLLHRSGEPSWHFTCY